MSDLAISIAIALPLAAFGALSSGLWNRRRPWRPGRVAGWFCDRAERKVARMPDLSDAERARRIALLRAERDAPPYPPRTFGEQLRHDFLVILAPLVATALLHLAVAR